MDLNALKRRLRKLVKQAQANDSISFFDVKTLYNEAYEQKAQARNALRRFKKIEAQARAMDSAYRAQLAGRRVA